MLREIQGAEHVCEYYGTFETKDELIILLRYLDGCELMSVINYNHPMKMEDIKIILTGIAKGLKECHQRNIIHRDIKPQNIVINLLTMEPTIIDFGMALDLKEECEYRKCGTPAYMAPEVLKCDKIQIPYGTKSDLFCLGVIAHIMMVG